MARRKASDRKIADNPIAKNLALILGAYEEDYKIFGSNLRLIEENLGIDQSTVRNWINGGRNPQIAALKKIAVLFKVDFYSLFNNPQEKIIPEQKKLIDMALRVKDKQFLNAAINILKIPLGEYNNIIGHIVYNIMWPMMSGILIMTDVIYDECYVDECYVYGILVL